jgi:phospholipase C
MDLTSRRQFLRSVATSAGATAALTTFPPAIQRALAIPAATGTRTIEDVQHIVVLMQENRSFDHYFGTLNGVRGFADRFAIPVADSTGISRKTVWIQPTLNGAGTPTLPGRPPTPGSGGPATLAPFALNTVQTFAHMRVEGTPHSWADAQAAWDHGRMNAWPKAKQNHSMGYFSQADLPFQVAMANAFTLCDAFHCSVHAGTNTNRLFLWTGTNDPLRRGNGPATSNSHDWFNANPADDYTWTTYPERLQAAGITWQVYENMADNFTDNSLVGFRPFRDAWYGRPGFSAELKSRGITTRDLDLLRADVVAGTLPQVSWIVATAEGSEHPGPSSPAQGADYTAKVLEALTVNPEVWSRTVLIVNFDENDGFFDHVPPPAAPSYLSWNANPALAQLAGASTVDTTGEYHEILNGSSAATLHRPYGLGPRVPAYIISPWSKGGWVNSQVFDHTSVLRFIEKRFGVTEPNISAWRRAVCGDLTSSLNFNDPDNTAFFASLPLTLAVANRARALPGTTKPPTPATISLPVQADGVRPSQAMPYELAATARIVPDRSRVGASMVTLGFSNTGTATAVFHVYDRLRLADIPRRYTVEPGKQLSGSWAPASNGSYDLWVVGPHGFHRHATGNAIRAASAAQPNPDVQVSGERSSGDLLVKLVNSGAVACTFQLVANRYFAATPTEHVVLARSETVLRLPLLASGRWYDHSVKVKGQADFSRRFAGRVETGAPSVSDPAMSGIAIADQWRVV